MFINKDKPNLDINFKKKGMALLNTNSFARTCLFDKKKLDNCVSETVEGNDNLNSKKICDFSRLDSFNEMHRIGRKSVSHFVDLSE